MLKSLKKLFSPGIELGEVLKTDIHSHLIPGIDDGTKTMRESLAILEKFIELGYQKVIITPHMMQDRYNNSHKKILNGLVKVKEEMIKKGMGLEVEVASEYYLDEQFERLLQDRELLSFGRKHILFEMSYTHEPKNLFDLVIEMQLAGYKPVLAHPERYHFMNKDHEIYHRLKEAKVLFQVNLLSFTDYYSKTIQKNALWLSNEKMIDFLGSDVHKMKHIDNIEVLKSKNILQNVIRENSLKNKFL